MTDLRLYQIEDIQEIELAIDAPWRSPLDYRPSPSPPEAVLYVLPTGAGKTVVASTIIERAAAIGWRVLVLTHRREILKQTSLKISGGSFEHGLIQAGLNLDLDHPIQIASIQTLWARCMRTDKIPLPPADLIIIDEAHHIAAQTWRKIIEAYPNARRIGLTATPCRGDGRGLGNYFTKLIEGAQVSSLIRQKFLVPTIYYAPVDPDLRGVQTRQGDYVVAQLADRMNRDDLIGDIVSNWHKHAERRKTLVFCVDVAHSVHVKDEFVKAGVRAEHIDGSTPKPDRAAALARLASGETELISNCMVLTEGFDEPSIGCIMLARPTKQIGLFRQMAGRGLRPAEGKTNLILIDHSGAVFRHGLLEDRVEWTLDVTKRAENAAHAARDRAQTSRLVECSQCSALRTAGEKCPHCGFFPQRRPDLIVFREGELARFDRNTRSAASTVSPEDRMRWHGMLAHIAAKRGYKPGWAGYKFKEKFGHWPPQRSAVPIEPSPECLSWVRSRNIAYAKAKERAS
jgi:DNA repair protein RadD